MSGISEVAHAGGKSGSLGVAAATMTLLFGLLAATPAPAVDFTVNSTADPGDGCTP